MERNQNSLSPSSEYVLQTLSCLLIFYLLTENPFDKSEIVGDTADGIRDMSIAGKVLSLFCLTELGIV